MNRISSNYEENVQWFNDVLGAGRSCDMVCRDLYVGGRRARFWVIDGFGGDAILERMGAFWLSLQPEAVQGLTEMQQFADRYVTFMEVNVSYDRDDIVTSVLMGKSLLVMEGLSGAALIDAKEYPSRSVGEPPDGKVLRGSHDGFIEAVVPNMAMLRRRIRDPHLTMEGLKVGQRTHSDVALCYLDDRVDHALLDELRHKLQNIQANSLTMAQESVAAFDQATVSFATFMDKQVLVLRREYPRNCVTRIDLSQQLPAYCTGLGKALLSTKSEEEIDEYIATVPRTAYTLHTLTDGARLKQDLLAAKEKGYAEDISEISDSLHCVAVPILTPHGGLWAISLSGHCSVIREYGVENIVKHLKKAVWDMTSGYSAAPVA